jgi:type I restriction enzyme M protein
MPKRHRPGESVQSVLSHVEDVVLATSGEDAFELVLGVAAARLLGKRRGRGSLREAVRTVAAARPELQIADPRSADDALLARVDALLAGALDREGAPLEALDAVFEALVSRVAKGDKGQYFTPRHVVDFVVRALSPRAGEVVVDPACGSGAFLAHARALARVRTFGRDVDARAVRVARLLALAGGRDPRSIEPADGLRDVTLPRARVVATNPPFAGRAPAAGFDVARVVRTPERDVLFLERALDLLEPGGRLGIVLPYSKAGGAAFAGLRRWLVDRARIVAVVGLPRETFLPHTSQRTFVLFAKRRRAAAPKSDRERTMFVLSERAGKDASGEPSPERHDLDAVLAKLAPFLAHEGFAS